MKIRIGSIAEIHTYHSKSFYVGRIVCFNENFIFFERVLPRGDFDGFCLLPFKDVYRLNYSSKYVKFFSMVLESNNSLNYCFDSPKALINYCFINNKFVQLSKINWDEDYCENVVLLNLEEDCFFARIIGKYGDLRRKIKIMYKDVSYLLFDSIKLKSYEIFISNNCFDNNLK